MLNQLKKINIIIHILLIGILFSSIYSQEFQNKYSIEFNSNFSNQWWSSYNNYGQEPSEIDVTYNGRFKKNQTNYYFSIISSKDKIGFSESFIKSKIFNNTYLKIGKYYRDFSLYLNDQLSSGSILISKNAEPMPKIGLISSYTFKKNNVDLYFGISHANFKKNENYNKAPMLHEKFIYLNHRKNRNEFNIGMVHEAMWGGSTEDYGNFPDSFDDFLKIFISADGPLLDGEPHPNALGNHLGIWDFSYIRKQNGKKLKIYYQHLFEDTSGLRFGNRTDGLWGLEFYNYIKNTNILFEFLNTINQDRDPPYVNESYYNHGEYKEGWSYNGYVLGNPFINAGQYSDINPSQVLHFGFTNNDKSKYNCELLLSRKIHIFDSIKYKLVFGKKINKLYLDIFIVGEENQKKNFGVKIDYFL